MSDGPYDFARERWEADNDALRKGRGPESRPGADEDVPTRAEAEADR